jgi:hypothetical protein
VVTTYKEAVKIVLDNAAPADFRAGRGGERSARRVLNERQAVLAALHFGNTGSLRALAILVSGMPLPPGAVADEVWQKRADADSVERFAAERAELQGDLTRIIDVGTFPAADSVRLERNALRLLKVPSERGDGDHYVPENPTAMLAHVVQVIRNPRKQYAMDLCRCEFCGDFFLASDKSPKTGKPRTKFCSKDHMLKAHAAGSTDRVRESRKARKREADKAASKPK